MGQLDNKVALVTGATSGIGRATAQRFADEGAFVFVTGRRQAELDATVKSLGRGSRGVTGDVSRLEDLDEIFAQVRQHGRGLDVLFANAGGGSFAPLAEVTPDGEQAWQRISAERTKIISECVARLPADQEAALAAALPALENLSECLRAAR